MFLLTDWSFLHFPEGKIIISLKNFPISPKRREERCT